MNVETYECSETAAEPIEACEEAVQIMEDLGLEGQKSLVSAKEDEPQARCPYRAMTAEEEFVFRVLCPSTKKLPEYDAGPIPLRVLQIASHASGLDLYKRFEVWYVAKQPDPDPVLVGIVVDGTYEWDVKVRHILARWGEDLESWPTLVKRAMEKKRMQIADVFAVLARKLQNAAGDSDMTAEDLIEKGAEWKPELRL
jgi:hypothetical protein